MKAIDELNEAIGEYIQRAPEFEGDLSLARLIGRLMADIRIELEEKNEKV